jgi:uncharacterized protein (TIGR02453 family)
MHFTPELFRFLKGLKANNKRDWFQANKERFESVVRGPMLRFIADFAPLLKKVHPSFVADPKPTGGSMFRIYRDIRFSEDKSPYKTHVAAHFEHENALRAVHVPGFYLHLEPGNSFSAGGVWHPDSRTLVSIRKAIVDRSHDWKKVVARVKIEGDSLTRPPKGFPCEHPFLEDLKRKDFVASAMFTDKQVCSPDFPKRVADSYKQMLPLMDFLAKATGL